MDQIKNRMLTTTQVAQFLNVGIAKAYRLFKIPGFPGIRIGQSYRVSEEALLEWVEEQAGRIKFD